MQTNKGESCIFEGLMRDLVVIHDPRVKNRCDHLLVDVMLIGVSAVLCGAECWSEIEEFAEYRFEWLKQFLELPNGIPSHDTIARVFSLIDASHFEKVFTAWATSLTEGKKLRRFSVDGKTVKGTYGKFNDGSRPLHLVSIFSTESGLVLGQSSASSSGLAEVEAALQCLEMVNIKDALVSADAGLSTKAISQSILDKEGDYIFPIKKNRAETFVELDKFDWSDRSQCIDEASTKEISHGREEERTCLSIPASFFSEALNTFWYGVRTVMKITRVRKTKDNRYYIQVRDERGRITYEKNTKKWKVTKETAFYISSAELSANDALIEVRDHWAIENKLHWSLDVTFKEDDWRARAKAAARNLALVRKFAFNVLAKNTDKGSKRVKMKRAAWNPDYFESLVAGI